MSSSTGSRVLGNNGVTKSSIAFNDLSYSDYVLGLVICSICCSITRLEGKGSITFNYIALCPNYLPVLTGSASALP